MWSPRLCICNYLPGDVNAVGPWNHILSSKRIAVLEMCQTVLPEVLVTNTDSLAPVQTC